jgi:hypothetical protein
LSFRISALMPGNACVADPGLVRVMPGSGVIRIAPVSGLPPRVDDRTAAVADVQVIPDPRFGIDRLATDPISRSERGSCFAGHSVPHFMNARIGVGAV